MVVCIAGRSAKLTACAAGENVSRSVQRLCVFHAEEWTVRYWLSFTQKLKKAGMKPSSRLTEKVDAWLKLSVRKAAYKLGQCETEGCRQRALGSAALCGSCLDVRRVARSQKSSGCHHNFSGFCQLCCGVARGSQHSAVAGSELGKQNRTCANGDCMECVTDAEEFCSECLLQLSGDDTDCDAYSAGDCETVRAKSIKPRRLLFSSEMSPRSGNVVSGVQSAQPLKSTDCIAPLCFNEGLDIYKGLCAACHAVLVKLNSENRQMPASRGS